LPAFHLKGEATIVLGIMGASCMNGRSLRRALRSALLVSAIAIARPAFAQTEVAPPPAATTEELEPRVVGAAGMLTMGFAGFVDRFNSTETLYATNYTAQVDVERFVTRRIAIRFGVLGSGGIGGDDTADQPTGPGTAAVHVGGGGLCYFTPDSMVSAYAGLEYWAQVTHRAANDRGTAVGKFGLQAAISSRASVFVEGGYGINLRRGDEGETITRIVGQLGLRIRF
jgi:hypothetical protein